MTEVYPFEMGPPLGARAALGLIVLQSDETIEHDFRRLLPERGVALYCSRIPSDPEVRRETLAQMEARLPGAAELLPRPVRFDAVGYGCTSATSVIGADRVAALIGLGCDTRHVTDPLSGLVAACRALGIVRLALLSPYVAEVSDGMRAALEQAGIDTPVFGTFAEAEETRVAKIDAASIRKAAQSLVGKGAVDGLFLSCTNLPTLDVIAPLEQATGLPVLSSNQVLAWHMLRCAGLSDGLQGYGRLWAV